MSIGSNENALNCIRGVPVEKCVSGLESVKKLEKRNTIVVPKLSLAQQGYF